jgi:hypothetical protein
MKTLLNILKSLANGYVNVWKDKFEMSKELAKKHPVYTVIYGIVSLICVVAQTIFIAKLLDINQELEDQIDDKRSLVASEEAKQKQSREETNKVD